VEAVVLSAGQGRRLLPHTRSLPKCLLPVGPAGETVLDVQLATLGRAGVRRVTVMVGFGSEQVERHVQERGPEDLDGELVFNPLHPHSDNLVSAWLSTFRVAGDFLLINGDTLFEPEVLERMLASNAPVAAAVNRKDAYDLGYCLEHVVRDEVVQSLQRALAGSRGTEIAAAVDILQRRFVGADPSRGHLLTGPVAVAKFELGEENDPETREGRLLRQREVSSVMDGILRRVR